MGGEREHQEADSLAYPALPPTRSFAPVPEPDADRDFEEWAAWADRELAAGRDPFPPERVLAQGTTISIGDAEGIDPELLAALSGPGYVSDGLGPQFGQGAEADLLPPGPVLAALTEAAVADVTQLSDNQLVGVLQAARRQENREAWKKALVIAEFARRRAAEYDAAIARGVPVHCRPGEFPGEELAIEMLLGPVQASHAIDDAADLVTRLPKTLAGMAAGLIDEARAGVIALHTRSLSPGDTALADEILSALAPELRLDRLMYKAYALEKKLNPEAVKARREHARRTRQRVEVCREESGNASVAGREMDTTDALAAKAHIHALALRLRRAGVPGTLDQLRLLVFSDLTAGRNPLNRLADPADQGTERRPEHDASARDSDTPTSGGVGTETGAGAGTAAPNPGFENARSPASGYQAPAGEEHPDDGLDYNHDDRDDVDDAAGSAAYARPPVPVPAMINLVVPAGTLFGWDTTPSEAGGWGPLDGDETHAIVAAASRHPATRWCFTLLGRDGTAVAHGCSSGQHPWAAKRQEAGPPGQRAPTPAQAAQFAAFLRGLNLTLEPIAKGVCDHAAAEPRYTPSRKLSHLVRARTTTCDAPGCAAQAVHADLDHTIPYPDGPTDQCNLGPKCRRHHKAKQSPGWKVEQPEPGVIRWTLPSGRTHTTEPTAYEFSDSRPLGRAREAR